MLDLERVKKRFYFVCLLNACSHGKLPDKALYYFFLMESKFGIKATITHQSCLVDALCRSGRIVEAVIWTTLLGACRVYGNVDISKKVSKKFSILTPNDPTPLVIIGNIFASKGMWKERDEALEEIFTRGLKKVPGMSWLVQNGQKQIFYVGNKNHLEKDAIQAKVMQLVSEIQAAGYKPNTAYVLKNVGPDQMLKELCGHSEKTAIAYSLMKDPSKDIVVYKNLRVCGDCHEATKWISRITGRNIKLRDTRRWHIFKDGKCSCSDIW